VSRALVDVLQRLLLREARGLGGVPKLGARQLHQIGGVTLVHDGEILCQSSRLPVPSQQFVRGGVERPSVDALAVATNQSFRAGQHLLGRATCESEKQDALGGTTSIYEMRNAVDERARLSGTGPGDNEERTIAVGGGCRLFRIELRREVAN